MVPELPSTVQRTRHLCHELVVGKDKDGFDVGIGGKCVMAAVKNRDFARLRVLEYPCDRGGLETPQGAPGCTGRRGSRCRSGRAARSRARVDSEEVGSERALDVCDRALPIRLARRDDDLDRKEGGECRARMERAKLSDKPLTAAPPFRTHLSAVWLHRAQHVRRRINHRHNFLRVLFMA